jgi:glutathione S-transferase
MELYFSPLACSMATRIALYEAGADARFLQVDGPTKRVADGSDFRNVNPLGLVPTLRTDDGTVLTENAAILQYVGSRFPDAELVPSDAIARAKMQQWICFTGTELHKALFIPLLDRKAPQGAKDYALENGRSRLDYLNAYLAGRDTLLDRFTLADAYLYVVLNWTMATPPVNLADWPNIKAYHDRLRTRPSIAKAFSEELALYKEEQERRKAA